MATQGPNTGSLTSSEGSGDFNWITDPISAIYYEDGEYARCAVNTGTGILRVYAGKSGDIGSAGDYVAVPVTDFTWQGYSAGDGSSLFGRVWTAAEINDSEFGPRIRCERNPTGEISDVLKVTGYGHTVPDGATIDGLQFSIVARLLDDGDDDQLRLDIAQTTVYYTEAAPAPVAAFSGTPLSGTSPLSVTFTDASTNTPTSWLWEKSSNGGSSWSNFSSGDTSQNPTESFAEGTWAVRLTATNAGGSDDETKLAYITVTSAASPCIYAIEGGDCIYKPANSSLECIYDNGGGCLLSNSRHKE